LRSLFIAALRLFMIIELVQEIIGLSSSITMITSPNYFDSHSIMMMFIPSIFSLILYVIVFWKASWLADKARIDSIDVSALVINTRSIVTGGIILFGIYGLANQFFYSFDYIFDTFISRLLFPDLYVENTRSGRTGIEILIRVMIYLYCIMFAGTIANVIAKPFVKEHAKVKTE